MQISIEPPYLVIKPGVTEEDFYGLSDEDADWEYLDGRLFMHSPASDRHEALFGFLLAMLNGYVVEKRLGEVRGSRYPMRLDPKWSPEPDVLVVRKERRHLMTSQRLEGPADLVIEIASESDPGLDYREKLPRYREAGIPEIWIVNPFEREVLVETKTESGYISRTFASGTVQSSVVPGFSIRAEWLWQDELPSIYACLRDLLGG